MLGAAAEESVAEIFVGGIAQIGTKASRGYEGAWIVKFRTAGKLEVLKLPAAMRLQTRQGPARVLITIQTYTFLIISTPHPTSLGGKCWTRKNVLRRFAASVTESPFRFALAGLDNLFV